jgi:hypothetical protein
MSVGSCLVKRNASGAIERVERPSNSFSKVYHGSKNLKPSGGKYGQAVYFSSEPSLQEENQLSPAFDLGTEKLESFENELAYFQAVAEFTGKITASGRLSVPTELDMSRYLQSRFKEGFTVSIRTSPNKVQYLAGVSSVIIPPTDTETKKATTLGRFVEYMRTTLGLNIVMDSDKMYRRLKDLGRNPEAIDPRVSSEEDIDFLRTESGTIYGFVDSTGTMYLDPKLLTLNTLFHEHHHIWSRGLEHAAQKGDASAKAIIAKREEVTKEAVEKVKENFTETTPQTTTAIDTQAEQVLDKATRQKFENLEAVNMAFDQTTLHKHDIVEQPEDLDFDAAPDIDFVNSKLDEPLTRESDGLLIRALSNSKKFREAKTTQITEETTQLRQELNAAQKQLGQMFKNKQGNNPVAEALKSKVQALKLEISGKETKLFSRTEAIDMLKEELEEIKVKVADVTSDLYLQELSDEFLKNSIEMYREQFNEQMATQYEYLLKNPDQRESTIRENAKNQQNALQSSTDYLIGNSTYTEAFQFVALQAILNRTFTTNGDVIKRSPSTVVIHNTLDSITAPQIYDELQKDPYMDVMEAYKVVQESNYPTKEELQMLVEKYKVEDRPTGYWVKVPQASNNPESAKDLMRMANDSHNIAKNPSDLSCAWCTGSSMGMAMSHNQGGDFYLFFNKDYDVKIAMRYTGTHTISEARGVGKNQFLQDEYRDEEEYFYNNYQGGESHLATLTFNKAYAKISKANAEFAAIKDAKVKEFTDQINLERSQGKEISEDEVLERLRAAMDSLPPKTEPEFTDKEFIQAYESQDAGDGSYNYNDQHRKKSVLQVYFNQESSQLRYRTLRAKEYGVEPHEFAFKSSEVTRQTKVLASNFVYSVTLVEGEVLSDIAGMYENLEVITGSVSFNIGNFNQSELSFPKLKEIGGSLEVSIRDNVGDTLSINAPMLETVGAINISSAWIEEVTTTFNAPNLKEAKSLTAQQIDYINTPNLNVRREVYVSRTKKLSLANDEYISKLAIDNSEGVELNFSDKLTRIETLSFNRTGLIDLPNVIVENLQYRLGEAFTAELKPNYKDLWEVEISDFEGRIDLGDLMSKVTVNNSNVTVLSNREGIDLKATSSVVNIPDVQIMGDITLQSSSIDAPQLKEVREVGIRRSSAHMPNVTKSNSVTMTMLTDDNVDLRSLKQVYGNLVVHGAKSEMNLSSLEEVANNVRVDNAKVLLPKLKKASAVTYKLYGRDNVNLTIPIDSELSVLDIALEPSSTINFPELQSISTVSVSGGNINLPKVTHMADLELEGSSKVNTPNLKSVLNLRLVKGFKGTLNNIIEVQDLTLEDSEATLPNLESAYVVIVENSNVKLDNLTKLGSLHTHRGWSEISIPKVETVQMVHFEALRGSILDAPKLTRVETALTIKLQENGKTKETINLPELEEVRALLRMEYDGYGRNLQITLPKLKVVKALHTKNGKYNLPELRVIQEGARSSIQMAYLHVPKANLPTMHLSESIILNFAMSRLELLDSLTPQGKYFKLIIYQDKTTQDLVYEDLETGIQEAFPLKRLNDYVRDVFLNPTIYTKEDLEKLANPDSQELELRKKLNLEFPDFMVSVDSITSQVYNKRPNETDEQWTKRLQEEVMARLVGKNAEAFAESVGVEDPKGFVARFMEWLNQFVDWLKSNLGLAKATVEELENMSADEFVERVTSSQLKGEFQNEDLDALLDEPTFEINVAGTPFRFGQRNSYWDGNTELVARERFNIPSLEILSSGSDRSVFDLGDGKVLKIAHSARGLIQNVGEGDYYLIQNNILPEVYETGLNYVVAEKVERAESDSVVTIENEDTGESFQTTMQEMLDEMGEVTGRFFKKGYDRPEVQAVLAKYGFEDVYSNVDNMLMADFTMAIENWGIRDGKPIHVDGGTFALTVDDVMNFDLSSSYLEDNLRFGNFREVYERSQKAKESFEDTDRFNRFQAEVSLETPLDINQVITVAENGDVRTEEDVQDNNVESWAKQNEAWINSRSIETRYVKRPELKGNESEIYQHSDGKLLKVKQTNLSPNMSTFMREVVVHNEIFPETAYKVVGFTRHNNDRENPLSVLMTQLEVEVKREATPQEIERHMTKLGFEKSISDTGATIYKKDGNIVGDLSPRNVAIDSRNRIRVIDPRITPKPVIKTPSEFDATKVFKVKVANDEIVKDC